MHKERKKYNKEEATRVQREKEGTDKSLAKVMIWLKANNQYIF